MNGIHDIAITDLIPYEPSALHSTVQYFKGLLNSNPKTNVPPIKVVQVGNHLVVRDGNSRLKAAHLTGRITVPCILTTVSATEATPFEDTLEYRLKSGYQSPDDFPVDPDNRRRSSRTLIEQNKINDFIQLRELEKHMPKGNNGEDSL